MQHEMIEVKGSNIMIPVDSLDEYKLSENQESCIICTDSVNKEKQNKGEEFSKENENEIPSEIIDVIDQLKFDVNKNSDLSKTFKDDKNEVEDN